MAASRGLVKLFRGLRSPQSARAINIQLFRTSQRCYSSPLTTTLSKPATDRTSNTQQKYLICCKENVRQISTSEGKQAGDVEALQKSEDEGEFDNFGISPETQEALRAHGIQKLFPVQSMGYKYITDGRDVVVKARTGTGKTLAFALPLVEKLLNRQKRPRDRPKAIVLTPTRELATQVEEHTRRLNRQTRITCVYGGSAYGPQENAIRNGLDVVVGTPGRMKDMIDKGVLNLDEIEHVILDEVDRMLDMGFQEIVDQILSRCYALGKKPQTLMFSATVPQFVKQAAQKYLSSDVLLIDLIGDGNIQSATTINQMAVQCDYVSGEVLRSLIRKYCAPNGKTIVFCETKRECDRVSKFLTGGRTLHGDVSQNGRNAIIQAFKSGRLNILVTTDVAARGLDIPNVDLVIQTNPPNDKDNFIHRTGRTGRAGKPGNAILLFKSGSLSDLKACEQVAKTRLTRIELPGKDLQLVVNSAIRQLQRINKEDAVELFGKKAQQLQEEVGAVESLSQALVLLSRSEDSLNKSLLTNRLGYRTFMFESKDETLTTEMFRQILEDILDRNADQVQGLCLNKRGNAVVFDVPKNLAEDLSSGIAGKCENGVLTKLMHKLPEDIQRQTSRQDNSDDLEDENISHLGRSSYGRSSYGSSRPQYGNRKPSYGSYRAGFSNRRSEYSDDRSDYGYGKRYASDESSEYGDSKSNYGYNSRSSYGRSRSQYNEDLEDGPRSYNRNNYSANRQSNYARKDYSNFGREGYGNRNNRTFIVEDDD